MMTLSTTFAVLIALFALLTTTTIISVSVSAAETITVDNWYITYRGPKTLDAKVGDTIVFEWPLNPNTGHNVFIHPTMNCLSNGAIFVGDVSPTSYTFGPTDAGTDMFFACEIGDRAHCNAGQNLIVTVSAAGDDGTAAPVEEEPAPTTIADSGATDTTPTTTVEDSGSGGTSFILFYLTIAAAAAAAAAALLVVLVAL